MAQDQPPRRSCKFPRSFRLKRQRLIRTLFERSNPDVGSVAVGCVRLVYRVALRQEAGVNTPLQIGFTTGKQVRRAVQRNRIKRLLRESFRLHQHPLVDLFANNSSEMLTAMVIFRGNPDTAAHQIPGHLPEALHQLASNIQAGQKMP